VGNVLSISSGREVRIEEPEIKEDDGPGFEKDPFCCLRPMCCPSFAQEMPVFDGAGREEGKRRDV